MNYLEVVEAWEGLPFLAWEEAEVCHPCQALEEAEVPSCLVSEVAVVRLEMGEGEEHHQGLRSCQALGVEEVQTVCLPPMSEWLCLCWQFPAAFAPPVAIVLPPPAFAPKPPLIWRLGPLWLYPRQPWFFL